MNLKTKTINSMRAIALDSINEAGQGHIGMAIGAAPITYTLIGEELRFSKSDPKWINRDRFVLSAGHGSMSQYSIQHFLGLLSLNDMKKHKVLGSKTPSHPEIDQFKFVDASTGPLGQGVAMAVGMAISQKYLQDNFNKKDIKLIDHNIYALHGDGCIQEGVALEAIQIAGTLQLNSLIILQDYNNVQIDSLAKEVNNTNIKAFYKSQRFDVFEVKDPTPENISKAILKARNSKKPSFIQIHTKIAHGTKMSGKLGGHNGVLSIEDTLDFKAKLGLKNTKPFQYDSDVYNYGKKLLAKKENKYKKWRLLESKYSKKYPKEYKILMDIYNGKFKNNVMKVKFNEENVATRNYIVNLMEYLESYPNIIGGSADLAAATKVKFKKDLIKGGKNIKYGIREFGMSAINNGIYLHSHIRTIDGTFLAFADYAKAAYRLGAIQEIPAIHVLTHDSYQVGGDGPTHEPFEQIPMLRAMHGLKVIRPADGFEMRAAFQYALDSKKDQIAIIGCRQPITSYNLLKGKLKAAYLIKDLKSFDVTLLASGSEVMLADKVSKVLSKLKIKARVISVPVLQDLIIDDRLCKELRLDKKPLYVIEATTESMWYKLSKYNKIDGFFAHGYGKSAPGNVVYEYKGFTENNISKKIINFLK